MVVGHGLVGHRFVAELARNAADLQPERLSITVLGAEPYEPYNRILLSEVLAGRADLGGITLPTAPQGVRVLAGHSVASLDRVRRIVVDHLGFEHPYDTLVLATGAAPRVPPLAGLPDRCDPDDLPPGVRALRTVDDCRELLALAGRSPRPADPPRVVVLGGGLLGLEAARALAGRGARVAVVHSGSHVLDRQLDAERGAVLAASLGDLGVTVVRGVRAAGLRRGADGTLVGVELSDGRRLACDALLLTAGVAPRIELAATAGLPCEQGILVGPDLRSPADPRIAAIGDCSQTAEGGCPGLLAPGWQQAERLARAIRSAASTPAPRRAAGTTFGREPDFCPDASAERAPFGAGGQEVEPKEVVRLKAADLDVVAFGRFPDEATPEESTPVDPDELTAWNEAPPANDAAPSTRPRVLSLHDPAGRRSLRLLVRDGRLAAGILVGAGALGADLVVAYERDSPLPLDPADLLVPMTGRRGGGLGAVSTPANIPGSATICRCNGVSKAALVEAFEAGERTMPALSAATRAGTGCGGCKDACQGILAWLLEADPAQPTAPAVGGRLLTTETPSA
nr:FAD-dependent oxidoreductase [Kineosphaera limosa]